MKIPAGVAGAEYAVGCSGSIAMRVALGDVGSTYRSIRCSNRTSKHYSYFFNSALFLQWPRHTLSEIWVVIVPSHLFVQFIPSINSI